MLNALLLCTVYIALLLSLSKQSGVLYTDIVKNNQNIKKALLIPVGISTVFLVLLSYATNALPDVFLYSPTVGDLILWFVPAVYIVGIMAKFSLIKKSTFNARGWLYLLMGTFFVGFSEELLVRGLVVSYLDEAGYSIFVTGILSSFIFGVLHFMNYFTGQDIKKTTLQVVVTILMGINFYIMYIVSGSLWLPIIIHFLYDFTILAFGHNPDKKYITSNMIANAANVITFITPFLLLFLLW